VIGLDDLQIIHEEAMHCQFNTAQDLWKTNLSLVQPLPVLKKQPIPNRRIHE
jgi:hypothetical protein